LRKIGWMSGIHTIWMPSWLTMDPDVVLTSPVAARLLSDPSGTVTGSDVMWGLSSVVLYYVNQKGSNSGEFMEFDAARKIIRVVANYNG
jgi:hypothetical protein